MTTEYTLVYPDENLPLEALARAALATVGSAYASTVFVPEGQALRIPVDAVDRVREVAAAGTAAAPPPPAAAPARRRTPNRAAASRTAPGSDTESPEPGAPAPPPAKTPGRPAARPAGRAKKSAAKKTTQRPARSSNEGDEQQ